MPDIRTRLRGAEHAARRAVERLRGWFDPPLDEHARPLEVREAVIDAIERRAEPTAAGRRAVPGNHVTITLLAPEKDDRGALEAAFADIDDAVRARLTELRCPVPPGFTIDVHVVKRPRGGWQPGQRFSVEYESRTVTQAAAAVPAAPVLRVTVLRGRASEPAYELRESWIRIGRTAVPTDHLGRPRTNHIVFLEDGDEHSATVGRAHASIQYDAARRQYRLFDDGSHNGTRVVRRGATLSVVPRNPVGITIVSGDELQFGTAAVVIEIADGA